MLERFEQVGSQALAELEQVGDLQALETFRIKYLGRKGSVIQLLSQIGKLPKEEKPQAGQLANKIKKDVTGAFESRKTVLERAEGPKRPAVDVTLPGLDADIGSPHVITQTIDELLDIFGRMGFGVVYGPEVEDERHNFVALNIPPEHPARDPLDNFYVDDSVLLRSQTSTIQIRVMETQKPPIRVVAPGRVYRPDTVDATHMYMFHQLEALVVDEGVTMVDMKTTIEQFIHVFFGPEMKWRFRPSFFPFTEPSAEVDLLLAGKDGSESWVEVGGCGMVDPNVFDAVGIDSEKYTGWAFGFGIERLAMRKYDITDIRWLYENDLRFLSQF